MVFFDDRAKMFSSYDPPGGDGLQKMARPREFDEQAVLDEATQRFWTKGYEATSMRNLAEGTGVTTPSLYNAFGDKKALYRLVLDRYVRLALTTCAEIFDEAVPPVRSLERYFDALIEEALADAFHKGCFVVNTALEVAPHDPDFRDMVKDVFARIEKHLRDCITAGQADGTIRTNQSAADLARLFLATLLGIRVLARTTPDRELLTGVTRPLLALLQTP
jgi:TetR/AcrR family transcriptional regulator, transcriptional repressor for nem operon